MKILLDTHAVLWWLDSPSDLGAAAYALIADPRNEVLISAVVPWEVAIKSNKHRLVHHQIISSFHAVIQAQGFVSIGIGPVHAIRSGLLPFHHKDPFDRLLIAQSLEMNIPIISRDSIFDDYGVQRIW